MAEPHDPAPGGELGLDPRLGSRRITDRVDGVEGPARRATVERPGQRTERGADHVGEIGARRRDDAGGEGRGVEAVVDREDHVLLDGPHRRVARALAGHHLEVCRGVVEVRDVRRQRREPETGTVERGRDRRDDGGDPERLGGALVGVEVDQRAQAEVVSGDGQGGADPSERRPRRSGEGFEDRTERGGEGAGAGDDAPEGGQLGGVGEMADGDEVPDLFEAAGAGERDGVVAAVVVPALGAEHVADRGVGDGDAVEAAGYVDEDGHAVDDPRPSNDDQR